jgi:glycosyltransferase involved in cell wall biosynthesis
MKVAILYSRLYEFDGTALSIGGIQTYLLCLAELIIDLGWEPVIFQLGDFDFERKVGQVKIIGKGGIPLDSAANDMGAFLTKHAENWIAGSKAIIIYGSDSFFANSVSKSIIIQHGVTWDLPGAYTSGTPAKLMHFLPSRYHGTAQRLIKKLRGSRLNQLRRTWVATGNDNSERRKSIRFLVCVDYNYLNVLKAQGEIINARTWIIPNFAELASPEEIVGRSKGETPVKILFARRFVWYRGTHLIAPVFKRILNACSDVSITFAGEGPDESWLREYFIDSDRVKFLRYRHDESANILLSHDITVIPSLGSEGTSLSAIEAMAAGCAVVATCVGGLTNIIIDGYNGKLVIPDEDELYEALYKIITDGELRDHLAERAYATVKESFSIDLWREKWRRVLVHVSLMQH